ncbi:MAG: acyl-CoA/acyl-ACP dehydrogenase [Deltaproteobacteria bacterium]|nr:acyl-CoA/acyl-ACP dehydrogenase [Deltaproteobacteria bacterium]
MTGHKPFLKNVTNSPAETYIRRIIRNWADTVVIPNRRNFDEDWEEHRLIEPAFKTLMVDLGFQKALIPAEFGGWSFGETDLLATASGWMFEEVARADAGIALAFGVCYWPMVMIAVKPHINRRLCAELAPIFVDSKEPVYGVVAMTEPQGGSDIENIELIHGRTIKTTARQDNDHWVINGHKLWPTNTGGLADLFGVVCTTSPGSEREEDIAYIYVPADTPGVTQGRAYEKAGMAADKNGDVWFEDVRVPLRYRAHGPGLDALYFKEVLTLGMMSATFSLGPMLNVYEILQDFCSRTTLHGRPLKEHDAVAAQLAEIVTGIEISRSATYRLAEYLDKPERYGPRWSPEILAKARLTKMFVADRCVEDCEKAMEILGACGADRDHDIEKHWRDIKMGQLYEGGKQLAQMDTARFYFDCRTL